MKISIVVPIFNEEDVILNFHTRLTSSLKKDFKTFNHEIIFVNDGSVDKTSNIVKKLKKEDKNIKFIEFVRNFGQHSAIFAGLKIASGNYIVIIDADLQDRPEEIINLYSKLKKGFNIVYAIRKENNNSFFKKYTSVLFWKLLKISSGLNIPPNQAMLKIFDRQILERVLSQEEINPFLPIIFTKSGLKQSTKVVKYDARLFGKSKYSLKKMLKLTFNATLYYSFPHIVFYYLIFSTIFNLILCIFLFTPSINKLTAIIFLIILILSELIFVFLSNYYFKRTKFKSRFNYEIR